MERIWIIGAGKFGQHALKGLLQRADSTRFTMVDTNFSSSLYLSEILDHHPQKSHHTIDFVSADGIDYLADHLKPSQNVRTLPGWIIAALPIHLAARWCQRILPTETLIPMEIPKALDDTLPNAMRGETGDLYVSHADFLCPTNCNEPDDVCTVTRKPRKPDMHGILEAIDLPEFESMVIQSRQLGPGIGGYRPEALFRLLDRIKAARGNILVGTACRCHGVLSGFERLDAQP